MNSWKLCPFTPDPNRFMRVINFAFALVMTKSILPNATQEDKWTYTIANAMGFAVAIGINVALNATQSDSNDKTAELNAQQFAPRPKL